MVPVQYPVAINAVDERVKRIGLRVGSIRTISFPVQWISCTDRTLFEDTKTDSFFRVSVLALSQCRKVFIKVGISCLSSCVLCEEEVGVFLVHNSLFSSKVFEI